MKYTGHKYDKRRRYIGHSLSFCVKDILSGVMPIKCVKAIHSGTRIETIRQWHDVIGRYKENYWHEYGDIKVYGVLNQLLFGNKAFYQCRLDGKNKILKKAWTRA